MSDIVTMRGHLAQAKAQESQLGILCSTDMIALNRSLDMFTEDPATLPVDEIETAAKRLKKSVCELREIRERITKIQKALGQ